MAFSATCELHGEKGHTTWGTDTTEIHLCSVGSSQCCGLSNTPNSASSHFRSGLSLKEPFLSSSFFRSFFSPTLEAVPPNSGNNSKSTFDCSETIPVPLFGGTKVFFKKICATIRQEMIFFGSQKTAAEGSFLLGVLHPAPSTL